MIDDLPVSSLAPASVQELQVQREKLEADQRAARLKDAVRHAGGNAAVAKRAGISLGTLNNYIAGRDMKTSFMVALADACGVNIAWLAAGRGPMVGELPPVGEKAQKSADDAAAAGPVKVFTSIDLVVFLRAMAEARELFRKAGAEPNDRELMQFVFLLYDAANHP